MEPVLALEPGNATTELAAMTPENRAPESPCAQEKPPQREAPTKKGPQTAAGEQPPTQRSWRKAQGAMKTQHSQKS
ncbi:unnamed protein product, partial [Rangifer tarandus platyrhynchus]